MRHTPGNWWADEGGHIHNDLIGTVKVAKVSGANAEEARANARLISAAPELLDALEKLLPMMVEWHEEFPGHVGDNELVLMRDASAAIRKAKGL